MAGAVFKLTRTGGRYPAGQGKKMADPNGIRG